MIMGVDNTAISSRANATPSNTARGVAGRNMAIEEGEVEKEKFRERASVVAKPTSSRRGEGANG